MSKEQIFQEPGTMFIWEPTPVDLQKFKGHTPGPWEQGDPRKEKDFYSDSEVLKRNIDGSARTKVVASTNQNFPDQARIDARLIAYAPELLAEVIQLRKEKDDNELQIKMLLQEVDEINECAGEELHQRKVYQYAVARYIGQVSANGIFPKDCEDLESAEKALKNIVGLI
jgi:hypothetical protein